MGYAGAAQQQAQRTARFDGVVVGPSERRTPSKAGPGRPRSRRCSSSGPRVGGRRLDDVRLAVMMLDGLEIAGRTHVVALGITTDVVKIPLGLWEDSTE